MRLTPESSGPCVGEPTNPLLTCVQIVLEEGTFPSPDSLTPGSLVPELVRGFWSLEEATEHQDRFRFVSFRFVSALGGPSLGRGRVGQGELQIFPWTSNVRRMGMGMGAMQEFGCSGVSTESIERALDLGTSEEGADGGLVDTGSRWKVPCSSYEPKGICCYPDVILICPAGSY
jgi:hypothetical protein